MISRTITAITIAITAITAITIENNNNNNNHSGNNIASNKITILRTITTLKTVTIFFTIIIIMQIYCGLRNLGFNCGKAIPVAPGLVAAREMKLGAFAKPVRAAFLGNGGSTS